MKLTFRQGLLSFQSSGGLQQFLQASSTSGYVNLSVNTTPCVVAFAHGDSNYLLKHEASISNAWGPMIPAMNNYLYWDINLINGSITRGITPYPPIVSSVQPAPVLNGQMWFDLSTNKMKEKTNGVNPWIERVRVFAGVVQGGNPSNITTFNNLGAGVSQVGLNNIENSAGFIIVDELGYPYRNSKGEFLTEESPVRIRTRGDSTGVLTSPVNNLILVRANAFIPAFTTVCFDGADSISPASSNPAAPKTPIGIVLTDISANETGSILQVGEVTSEDWTWDPVDFGKPLYADFFGRLTTTRPQTLQVYRVGFVKNAKTILFGIDSETQSQIVASPGSIVSALPPLISQTSVNPSDEIVTTISIPVASETNDGGFMSPAQVTVLNSLDGRLTSAEDDIDALQTSKSDVGHVHAIANVTGLQTALDGKAAVGHNHDSAYSSISHDHDAQYAPLGHEHQVSDVEDLQTLLNAKAPLAHLHTVANVTGLQTALDERALSNHSHSISNVTGLQSALDDRSLTSHSHLLSSLGDVNAAGVSTGQVLVWNGSVWFPGNASGGGTQSLVTTTVAVNYLADPRLIPWTGQYTPTYLAQYQNDFPQLVQRDPGTLDPTRTGSQARLDTGNMGVSFNGDASSISQFPIQIAGSATCFEYIMLDGQSTVGVMLSGSYTNGEISYGNVLPPQQYVPNGAFTYTPDGIITFNEPLYNYTQFSFDDVIGVVIDTLPGGQGDTRISFYKNGVLVSTSPLMTSLYNLHVLVALRFIPVQA